MTDPLTSPPVDVDGANAALLDAMIDARPHLVGTARAGDVIPALDDGVLLHAGPPLEPSELSGPSAGALAGALVYEGRARDVEAATRLLNDGAVPIESTHSHGIVGPMTGVVSASMPVFVLNDPVSGLETYVTINEGLGSVLRFGANSPAVIARLAWIAEVAAPVLDRALREHGPIDLVGVQREALIRGDECHNRNKAATAQFVRLIAADIARTAPDGSTAASVLDFVSGNDHFFLNLSMSACKLAAEVASADPRAIGSTIVTTIASNGVRLGIRVGAGAQWWTAPAPLPHEARWLDGHSRDDAAPLVGDSFATEVAGLGAFAAAGAPAISAYVGGTVADLLAITDRMYGITAREHATYLIPHLDYRGTPVGIDVRAVAATGVAPVVNAGFAGRIAGTGQVGAGVVTLPIEPFLAAAGTPEVGP